MILGHRGLKRSTSDVIRTLSIKYKSSTFTKDDLDIDKRCILGPLSRRGYIEYSKLHNTYIVTDAGHRYVRLYTEGDTVD